MIVRSEQTKKNDVIDNAEKFINVKTWHPTVDIAMCDPDYKDYKDKAINPYYEDNYEDKNFRSCFRKNKDYNVIPYVYTGQDDVDTFRKRVLEQGICPGGWDRTKGLANWFWWATPAKVTFSEAHKKYAYGYRTSEFLAGVDCSNYVSRCWKIGTRSTRDLPGICVEINKYSLKRGDILNKAGDHVRIFNKWVGATKIDVYEARGGPTLSQIGNHKREFRNGDNTEPGCVVKHTIKWDNGYTPYSIFPQFKLVEPHSKELYHPRPTFKIRVLGNGRAKLKLLRFTIDDKHPPPQSWDYFKTTKDTIKDTMNMDLIYTPSYDLTAGSHSLFIEAATSVPEQSFRDDFFWEFWVVEKR